MASSNNFDKIAQNILKQAKSDIKKNHVIETQCPNCKKKVKVKNGKNTCSCGQVIEVKYKD